MNLKQFLKSDWRKIVVFAILIILEFICLPMPNIIFTDPPTTDYSQWQCISLLSIFPLLFSPYEGFDTTLMRIIIIFVSFLITYLLSCLIVWIYDKFRKKKK